ncbi:hypothetical protein JOM56_012993 [Amanita muscaria]
MAKRKPAPPEQAPVVLDQASASLIVPNSQVGRGIRRAKADALNNAVWKQDAPGASHKRAASTTTPHKTVRKSTKRKKGKAEVEFETHAPTVSIPIPQAPKKKKATKPRQNATGNGHKTVITAKQGISRGSQQRL